MVCVDNSPTSCIQQIFAKFQSSLWEQIDNSYWIEIFFPFPKGRVGQAEQSNLNSALFLYNWLFDLKTQKNKKYSKNGAIFFPFNIENIFLRKWTKPAYNKKSIKMVKYQNLVPTHWSWSLKTFKILKCTWQASNFARHLKKICKL